jgi:hypothetical protein
MDSGPTRARLRFVRTWPEALDRNMEAQRDVLDAWGDGDLVDLDVLDERMSSLRRSLFELRQWDKP